MRLDRRFRAILALAGPFFLLAPASADDAPRFVRPSVEELAIPPQKPVDTARESDTRAAASL